MAERRQPSANGKLLETYTPAGPNELCNLVDRDETCQIGFQWSHTFVTRC